MTQALLIICAQRANKVDINTLIGIEPIISDSICFDSPQTREQDTTTRAALPTGRDTLNFLPSQGSEAASGGGTHGSVGPGKGAPLMNELLHLRSEEEADFFGLDRDGIEINPFESRTKAVQKFNQQLRSDQSVNSSGNTKTTKTLRALVEFLVQMDGVAYGQKGIVVIGATNRPGNLDPAFIRPGRFSKIITLELPGKKKRIEILKLYSRNLGIDKTFCSAWDYIINRTAGFSAADLAAVMNQSAIQSILAASRHSVKSFEKGID
jgi:SpoVK/Ycf46/Vps4 family AAA+-type ATPase